MMSDSIAAQSITPVARSPKGWQPRAVSYPLHRWRVGDEVWALYLNRDTTPASWSVALKGRVVAVERTRFLVRSRRGEEYWTGKTEGPLFPRLDAAKEWVKGNPVEVPGAPEGTGQKGMGRGQTP